MTEKVCTKCRETFPLTEDFFRRRKSPPGMHWDYWDSWCRACHVEAALRYNHTHKHCVAKVPAVRDDSLELDIRCGCGTAWRYSTDSEGRALDFCPACHAIRWTPRRAGNPAIAYAPPAEHEACA